MSEDGESSVGETPLLVKKHIQYFKRILNVLPHAVSSMDTSRYLVSEFLSADELSNNMVEYCMRRACICV